jgi:iron complex outermembrane recepter protein
MRSFTLVFFLLLGTASAAFAQTFSIRGRVLDRVSGETLPGASVGVVGTSQGGVSDGSGSFRIGPFAPGTYTIRTSFIGYQNLEQKVTITNKDEVVVIRLAEDNTTLNEVQVVAQVAVERETPVAFSAVNEVKLRESLAGRDLPLILNETPGVYATQGGGGTGDSRISIRGFDQRNVAVMINGVPVNDMENGAVYWSNWDLGDVTKNLQVQRGLTASKLAVPSVGGTINVLTKGFEAKRGGRLRQEVGYNGYRKTSLMLSTGQMKGDWAVTVFGSRRTGNGWVDALYDDAWTYFGTVSKKFGKHQISLTGLGSPQKHGQRSFAQNIGTFSKEKAQQYGDTAKRIDRGFRFNQQWDDVNRYTLNADGTRGADNIQRVNSSTNYYHKPQVSLNHFWQASDKLFISNVVYGSVGRGGGISTVATPSVNNTTGRHDLQKIYDTNIAQHQLQRTVRARSPITGRDTIYNTFDAETVSSNYLRASVNNHKWVGFITSADYKLSPEATLSAGIDGRYYRGEHYREVKDLLGGQYALESNVSPTGSPRTPIGTTFSADQNAADPFHKLRVGDKTQYYNDAITRSLGGYSQLEYKKGPLAGFVSGTFSVTTYQNINYFRARPYQLSDGTKIDLGVGLTAVPGIPGSYLTPLNQITVARAEGDFPTTLPIGPQAGISQDTTLTIGTGETKTYNGRTYTGVQRPTEPVTSEIVKIPGFTAKTGFNYNLTEDNNIFFNIGYLSRPQFLAFIFSTNGDRIQNPTGGRPKNENVFSVELGYAVNRPGFKAALNAYRTNWYNRSTTFSYTDPASFNNYTANVAGLDATHQGIELDIAQEVNRQLSLNAAFSVGDWRWASKATYRVLDENNQQLVQGEFNPKGVHVGGSAQNQFMIGVRYEPLQGLYVRPTFTLFSKYYADFNPSDLTGPNPQDAFRLPTSRNVDLHAGFSRDLSVAGHTYRYTLNGSILNVLNEFYITDAPSGGTRDPFNPSNLPVYFNMGRRATVGLALDF